MNHDAHQCAEASEASEARNRKTICVVLDSNLWRQQYGLRSHAGAAFLFLLQQREGVLGLPEVVEMEIVKVLSAAGRDEVQSLEESFRRLRMITGSHPAVTLPSDQELLRAVQVRLAELDSLFVRVSLDLEQTRRALASVQAGRAPNQRREQTKDSLIWEATRLLASTYDVHLVTDDGAFFRPDGKGLAVDLAEECERDGLQIQIHRNIAAILAVLRAGAPDLDYSHLAEQLLDGLRLEVERGLAEPHGFKLGAATESKIEAFATEDLNRLFLTFELAGPFSSIHSTGRRFSPVFRRALLVDSLCRARGSTTSIPRNRWTCVSPGRMPSAQMWMDTPSRPA